MPVPLPPTAPTNDTDNVDGEELRILEKDDPVPQPLFCMAEPLPGRFVTTPEGLSYEKLEKLVTL